MNEKTNEQVNEWGKLGSWVPPAADYSPGSEQSLTESGSPSASFHLLILDWYGDIFQEENTS